MLVILMLRMHPLSPPPPSPYPPRLVVGELAMFVQDARGHAVRWFEVFIAVVLGGCVVVCSLVGRLSDVGCLAEDSAVAVH